MKKNDKRDGIWIPANLINNENLDWTNRALMSEIMSLSKLEKGCIASNEHFAQLLGIGRSSVSKRITNLEKLGIIITNNIYDNKRCVGRVIQLREEHPETTKSTSDKNHHKTISNADSGSTKNQGMVPTSEVTSSVEDDMVVPEGIDSGSQKKPNNTLNKTKNKIPENIPESRPDTSTDTGENSSISSQISSSPNKPVDEVALELAALSRADQKFYLNMLFKGYPNWESDLYKCSELNAFLKKNEKYYVYDDDSEGTHWNYCLIKAFYER